MDFDIGGLVDSVEGAISDAVDDVEDAVDDVEDALDDVEDAVDDIEDGDVDAAIDDVEDAADDLEDAADDLDDAADDVEDAVLGATSSIADACEDWESEAEETFTEDYKLVVGAFINSEELQEQSDEMIQQGINQDAKDVGDIVKTAWDDYVASNQEVQDNEDATDQAVGDYYTDTAKTAWDGYINYTLEDLENEGEKARDEASVHDIVLVNGGASASDAVYAGDQVSYGIDLKTFETKILETQAYGLGTPSASAYGSVTWAKSTDGWDGFTGKSTNIEGSVGPVSGGISVSNSCVASTMGLGLGPSDIEAEGHITESNTVDVTDQYADYKQQAQEGQEKTDQAVQDYYARVADETKTGAVNGWKEYVEYNQQVQDGEEKTDQAVQDYYKGLAD